MHWLPKIIIFVFKICDKTTIYGKAIQYVASSCNIKTTEMAECILRVEKGNFKKSTDVKSLLKICLKVRK